MDQRSGRSAEKEFSLLCSKKGITCNPSSEDDHGWDFVVEVPLRHKVGLPADHARPTVQVLVQIKSTTGQRARTQIEVSNALNFAKSSLPCFIVLFQAKDDGSMEVYARHFSDRLIADTLKRARELSTSAKKPNQTRMYVRFREQDRPTSIVDWLVATLENLPEDYASVKRDFGARVGYEEGWLHGEIQLGPLKGIGELIDHQLGLTPTIPVSSLKIVDRRFGIEAPTPVFQGVPMHATFRSLASKDCQVVFMAVDGDSMMLSASLTVPAIPALMEDPSQDYKIKIETWFLSVVVQRHEKVNVEFGFPTTRKIPLRRMVEIARLISWGSQGPIDLKVIGNGMHLLSCRWQLNQVGNEPYFRNLATIADTLHRINLRAATEAVDLSLDDFEIAASEVTNFHDVLTAADMRVDAVLWPNCRPSSSYSHMIGYAEVEIGQYLFFVVCEAAVTEQTLERSRVKIDFGPIVWRDCLVGRDIAQLRSEGRSSYDRWRSEGDGSVLAVGNILAVLEQNKDGK